MVLLEQVRPAEFGYTLSLDDYLKLSEDKQTHLLHDFIYQSNWIEGISDHYGHTIPKGAPIIIPSELRCHEIAFAYVLNKTQKRIKPSSKEIRKLHSLLMEELLTKDIRGHWRNHRVEVRVQYPEEEERVKMCPMPESVPRLMQHYQEATAELAENPTITRGDLLRNHAYFEWIHPFSDGNGRTGRLLLNWLSLIRRKEFYVIESQYRQEYYQFLQSMEQEFNKKHPGIAKKLK